MQFPLNLAALASRIPFWFFNKDPGLKFNFTIGDDIFLPDDLVEMNKPGAGIANGAGDLLMLPMKKYNRINAEDEHSVLFSSLSTTPARTYQLPVGPSDHVFWLDSREVAHLVNVETEEYPGNRLDFYVRSLGYNEQGGSLGILNSSLIGTLPTTTASDFRYVPEAKRLVFFDSILKNGAFTMYQEEPLSKLPGVPPDDLGAMFIASCEPENREHPAILSVPLYKEDGGNWTIGSQYARLTPHDKYPQTHYDAGLNCHDYDVSEVNIIYKSLAEPTPGSDCNSQDKEDIYIGNIDGAASSLRIASGRSIHSPTLHRNGTKAAWFELRDGMKRIIVYDVDLGREYILTELVDFAPLSLVFSRAGDMLYVTGGDDVMVSLYSLPVPDTTRAQGIDTAHIEPTLITQSPSLHSVQVLPDGSLLATQSSYASPNEAVVIRWLQGHKLVEKVTHVNDDVVKSKQLDQGEMFTIPDIEDEAHGWLIKPKGFRKDDGVKRPAILISYEGPPGMWKEQWSKLSNPNIFAAQGFFCVLINRGVPITPLTVGLNDCNATRQLTKLGIGWKHILETYPEIDPERTILLDESSSGFIFDKIQSSGSENGLRFKASFGIYSEGHNMYYSCLVGDEIYPPYDFLASVAD